MSYAPGLSSSIFSQIPANIEVPGTHVEVQPIYDDAGLLVYPARILLVAQMLASGNAVPGRIYPLLTPQNGTFLCGAGSMGEYQARMLLATKTSIPMDIICQTDAVGSAKATANFNIQGNWSTAGVMPLQIAGVRILVPVQATDAAADVAATAVALINSQSNPPLPVTAVQGSATTVPTGTQRIILTANHGGTEGNTIELTVANLPGDRLPTGMTVVASRMAGGTLNPSIQPVLDAISGLLYSDVVIPWQDATNFGLQSPDLDARYNAMAHLDAHVYACITGTYGNMQSAKASLNSRFRTLLGITRPQSPHWGWSAAMGGVCAQRLFDDPSHQCKGLVLPGVVAPLQSDRIDETEQQLLLQQGISTFNVLRDGTVVLSKVVTENVTDDTGTFTIAWHDIMAPKVATRMRYDWRAYVSVTYPSNKLADDGSLAAEYDPTVATPNRLKGSWAGRMNVYGKQGWIEDIQNQARKAVFARDQNDRNRVNSTQPYQRVGNLMVLATMLQFEV